MFSCHRLLGLVFYRTVSQSMAWPCEVSENEDGSWLCPSISVLALMSVLHCLVTSCRRGGVFFPQMPFSAFILTQPLLWHLFSVEIKKSWVNAIQLGDGDIWSLGVGFLFGSLWKPLESLKFKNSWGSCLWKAEHLDKVPQKLVQCHCCHTVLHLHLL